MSDARGGRQGAGLGSAYFLGFAFAAFAVLLWLRGMGRLLVPALLIGLVVYGVYRFVQLVRAPLDPE
jgi:hypothetical protein